MSDMGRAGSEAGGGKKLAIVGVSVLAVAVIVAVGLAVRAATSAAPGEANAATGGTASNDSIDAILNSVEEYRRRGDTAKMELILKEATASYPGEQRLAISYGELLAANRRNEEAYAQYEKALAIGPRDAATEFMAGTLASMIGRDDRAVEHYAAAQAANASDWRAPLFLGQVQLKQGEVEEAKKNLLIAARLRPETAAAWGTLAEIALRENKPTIALQHIDKARELEPRVTVWRLIEARALKRDNKPEEALKLLIGLEESQQMEPGVMPLMAECFGMLGRPADAAEMYVRAADRQPGDGQVQMDAALWLERAGDMHRAVTYAMKAKELGVEGAEAAIQRMAAKGKG